EVPLAVVSHRYQVGADQLLFLDGLESPGLARAVLVGPGGHREAVLHVVGVCRFDRGQLLSAFPARVTLGDDVLGHGTLLPARPKSRLRWWVRAAAGCSERGEFSRTPCRCVAHP